MKGKNMTKNEPIDLLVTLNERYLPQLRVLLTSI